MSAAIAPRDVADVQAAVREHARLLPVGAGTKPALSTPPPGTAALDMTALSGIVEHDPRELTVTALAGTPVATLAEALAAHDQHLPFDPPLRAAGATLGGVVAAGTSGPGAFRHGGVRDFVIGVRFVDGTGELVGGGGRVVKNAAGFDFPKLLVGSRGRLGAIVQLSFKVFPRPRATTTAVLELDDLGGALAAQARIARGPLAVEALDLELPGRLLVRLSGPREQAAARVSALAGRAPAELLDGEAEAALWTQAAELAWAPPGTRLVRVALTPSAVAPLERELAAAGARARYSVAANVAWVAWPGDAPLDALRDALVRLRCAGTPLTGPRGPTLLGDPGGGAFAQRIRRALDPDRRFCED